MKIKHKLYKRDKRAYKRARHLTNKSRSFRNNKKSNELNVTVQTWERIVIDGYTFTVKVFVINHRLDKIQLLPVLEMKDPGYPDRKYQEEKKKVADSFLRARLGEPLKENESVLYYEFDWGSVSSVAFLSGRNEYTGGFIEVEFTKGGKPFYKL